MKNLYNWDEEAIRELREYGQWRVAYRNLTEEISFHEELLLGELEPVQRKSILFHLAELKERILPIRLCCSRVERTLEALYPRERALLEDRYVRGIDVDKLLDNYAIEKTAYYNLRRRALDAFIRGLYGVHSLTARQPAEVLKS